MLSATAQELRDQQECGELSSVEITSVCLDAIDEHNEKLNAFLTFDRDDALQQARRIDERRAAGETLGPLAGLPVAIKDNICIEGVTTTCASRSLENFRPPYSAHVIDRLRNAGAVLLGKTNLDEFAMGSSTENSAYGPTRNPHNLDCTPGGSSGGSAAAVAASLVPLAVGSDTGGSIRQPAAFCGIVGMKPTYGRVSRYGLVAFASSLDQIGPFARDVTGAAMLLEGLAGYDDRDSTCINQPVAKYSQTVDQPLEGLRIGVVKEYLEHDLDDGIRSSMATSMDIYRSLGAEVKAVSLPHANYSVATYYLIGPSEASSNLARYDGVHYGHRSSEFDDMIDMYCASRGEGFGAEVKRRVMLGTYALSAGYYDAYYLKALKVRRLIRNDYDAAFQEVDVIASPTTPHTAFQLGVMSDVPLSMYLSDLFTIGCNLAGIPGISIPCGVGNDGMPIGLQLMGRALEEETLFRAARMFERETDWHQRRAAL